MQVPFFVDLELQF